MASFGLVHGGMHGAWCWDRLSPELRLLGHEVWTVDLPSSEPTAGCAEYADVAVQAFSTCPSTMILVGHSLGGLTIPLIPSRRSVSRLAFLCALLPKVGMTFLQQDQEEDVLDKVNFQARTMVDDGKPRARTADSAINAFYHDVREEDAAWARGRLVPQARRPTQEITPLTEWPDVPSSYILGAQDRAVRPEWSRRAARERLGVEAFELNTGHSPFLSRPKELAILLDAIAQLR